MENKTEFFKDKLMEVSDDSTYWVRRIVFGKRNYKYLALAYATTVEEAEKEKRYSTWDYAREIDPFRELKEAFERGEDIQIKLSFGWVDATEPAWTIGNEYRIKPKPKYVPFTFEDAELFMNKTLIAKDKTCSGVITYAHNEGVEVGKYKTDYKSLFDDYTFIDGSPCGKEVEV